MKPRAIVVVSAVVILGALGVYSLNSSGQQPPASPQRLQVNVVDVKPDMIDAWKDVQVKQTIPALKKAGVPQRDVYETIYGPIGRFYAVTPIAKFADRDGPSPIARALGADGEKAYNATVRKLVNNQSQNVIEIIADGSYDPMPNAVYPVGVLTFNHAAPGHGGDFVNYIRNDVLPAQKRGQVKRYTLSHSMFGGDPNEFGTIAWTEKIADLDAGSAVVRALGQDGAAKLTQKTAGIVTSTERHVIRHVDALSYRPRPTS